MNAQPLSAERQLSDHRPVERMPGTMLRPNRTHIRTLFLSDLHLGFRHSRPEQILACLQRYQPDQLYLLGDFIDGWCLGRSWHWSDACSRVVTSIADLAASGTHVRLVAGNHDDFLRSPLLQMLMQRSGFCELADEFLHQLADGRRFLVLHGDQFDPWEKTTTWTSAAIGLLYDLLLRANSTWGKLTQCVLQGDASLACRVKRRLRALGSHLTHFRTQVARHARCRGFHGVICGHIHQPELLQLEGLVWCNTGDWIENCTAVIEHHCGSLELIHVDSMQGPEQLTPRIATEIRSNSSDQRRIGAELTNGGGKSTQNSAEFVHGLFANDL
jgi:UDP-2,3-diacylglucosamine pyrophosphatase LpxH